MVRIAVAIVINRRRGRAMYGENISVRREELTFGELGWFSFSPLGLAVMLGGAVFFDSTVRRLRPLLLYIHICSICTYLIKKILNVNINSFNMNTSSTTYTRAYMHLSALIRKAEHDARR